MRHCDRCQIAESAKELQPALKVLYAKDLKVNWPFYLEDRTNFIDLCPECLIAVNEAIKSTLQPTSQVKVHYIREPGQSLGNLIVLLLVSTAVGFCLGWLYLHGRP